MNDRFDHEVHEVREEETDRAIDCNALPWIAFVIFVFFVVNNPG